MRILSDSVVEEPHGLLIRSLRADLRHLLARLEVQVVSVDFRACDGLDIARRLGESGDRRAHLRDDGPRDLVLNGEDISQVAVVTVRPLVIAVPRLDELRRDANPVPGLPDRAFDDVRDVQELADLAEVLVLPLERERRRAAGDAQSLNLRKNVEELLGDSIREILLIPLR